MFFSVTDSKALWLLNQAGREARCEQRGQRLAGLQRKAFFPRTPGMDLGEGWVGGHSSGVEGSQRLGKQEGCEEKAHRGFINPERK